MAENNNPSKAEFLDYIKDHKDEVSLDTDDGTKVLYEICSMHKKLPLADRNWDELAGMLALGEGIGGEWLRSWTKERQRRDGTLPRNIRLNIPSDRNDAILPEEEPSIEDLRTEKKAVYEERQRLRDTYNANRRLMREESRVDLLKELMAEAADKAPEIPDVKYNGTGAKEENEGILMLGDFHIGDEIHNFYNNYDSETAARRLGKVVNTVVLQCSLDKVGVLNVVNLGDLINGLIHTSARLEQEMDVTKQIMFAADLLAKTLIALKAAAPRIVYRSCLDNHSRAMADLHESIENENFSRLIDFYLRARLAGSGIEFADDNLSPDIGKFDLANGKKVIFVHGHLDSPSKIFQTMVGATHEYVDYCLMGHYHSPAYREEDGCRIITNGSLCGTEQYAYGKRYFGKASQTLLIFQGNDLHIDIIDCDL